MPDCYPYTFKYKNTCTVTAWCSSEDTPDRFLTDSTGNILLANSIANLLEHPQIGQTVFHSDQPGWLNLNSFFKKLNALKAGVALSTRTCHILLNGFNFLQDIAYSLQLDELQLLHANALKHSLNKLFFGNNLASVTPEDQSYAPVYTQAEIRSMQQTARAIWRNTLPYLAE